MPLRIKANIQLTHPYTEWKVKYFILVQVKTENPTFDKKNKTIVSFHTIFYKSFYGKLFKNIKQLKVFKQ